MRQNSLPPWIVLLLFVMSQTAHARRIPTEPAHLSAADRREILNVLGLDSTRVRSIDGFQVRQSAGAAPATSAMVKVAGEVLAFRIESGREILCYKSESRWICDAESSVEMLYASLPEGCPAEVAPNLGERFVRMPRDKGPSIREVMAIVELICSSEQMAEEAWSLGHKVMSARRNADGELEVSTKAPDTEEAGLVFVLEERCDDGACKLVVREKLGWIT